MTDNWTDAETAPTRVRSIFEAHWSRAQDVGDVSLPQVVDATVADVQQLAQANPVFGARLIREVVRSYVLTLATRKVAAHVGHPSRDRPEPFERWLERTRAAARSPAHGRTGSAVRD